MLYTAGRTGYGFTALPRTSSQFTEELMRNFLWIFSHLNVHMYGLVPCVSVGLPIWPAGDHCVKEISISLFLSFTFPNDGVFRLSPVEKVSVNPYV